MKSKLVAALISTLALAGCGTSNNAGASATPTEATTVTVYAASSLTKTFTELGKEFEAANPGSKVVFSFGASSTLAEQITAGAPADVFASASKKSMDAVATEIPESKVFASNRVVVGYPVANALTAVTDLNSATIRWIQCDHQVPCGAAADAALTAEGITGTPISLEPDVKSVTTKLTTGEVDAAIIYITDVIAAGSEFAALEFSDQAKATTNYPIGVTASANVMAQKFVDFVLSTAGQKVLSAAGFAGAK